VLFPPCTLLTVQAPSKAANISGSVAPRALSHGEVPVLQEDSKRFLSVEVFPTFV
jgi:hypothetical protein